MKQIWFVVVGLAMGALLGCGAGATVASSDSLNAASPRNAPSPAGIVGQWKGELKMPKAAANDPTAKMAEAMGQMFMSGISLEIREDDTFKMTMMGMPFEGRVAKTGRKLILRPQKMLGLTVQEAKKLSGKNGSSFTSDPMKAELSADGKTITLLSGMGAGKESTIVFTRKPPEKKRSSSVRLAEAPLVGSYKGSSGTSPTGSKQAMQMRAMEAALSLQLRQDNTFILTMLVEIEGVWSSDGRNVTLMPKTVMGMDANSPNAKGNMKDPIRGIVSNGVIRFSSPNPNSKEGKLVFKRT